MKLQPPVLIDRKDFLKLWEKGEFEPLWNKIFIAVYCNFYLGMDHGIRRVGLDNPPEKGEGARDA
jgi:hypothetical protein